MSDPREAEDNKTEKTEPRPGEAPADANARTEARTETEAKAKEEHVREMLKLCGRLGEDGCGGPITDAISQALLTILGSGPSFAVLGSMFAVNQANGLMYYNAVSNQQKTNLLSMAMTAKCVRYMFDVGADEDSDFDDIIETALREE